MKRLSLWTLTALLAASPAIAFPGAGERPSEAEREEARAALFAAADADDDGFLELEEFTAFQELVRAEHLEKRFARLDQDQDGAVSATELEDGASHRRNHRGRR